MRSICNYLSNLDFVPTQAKTYLGITILVFKRFLLGTPPPTVSGRSILGSFFTCINIYLFEIRKVWNGLFKKKIKNLVLKEKYVFYIFSGGEVEASAKKASFFYLLP